MAPRISSIKVGQYWRTEGGVVVKVIKVINDPPASEPRKAGTIQLKRMDTGFVFWNHVIDLKIKASLVPEKDVPLVLLGGY